MTDLIRPANFRVFCDESGDRKLLNQIRANTRFLSQIPDDNISILPKGQELHSARMESIVYLADYDRPDFIFLYQDIPVLVVELTEHGYTGDNPLQRFTRFATTAENRIPFIYFTPWSRVRDDELDIVGRKASKRKVNTDVWKGMSRLAELFEVPQLTIEWTLAPNGKALKLGLNADANQIQSVFGELLNTIEHILSLSEQIGQGQSIINDPYIHKKQKEVKELWETPNTRVSTVKKVWHRESFGNFLKYPTEILKHIPQKDYFFKDKPERLLALQCVKTRQIETLEGLDFNDGQVQQVLAEILDKPVFDQPVVYYTGYQWRSDPHCGVAVNLDYLVCRKPKGLTPKDRVSALVLYWPRIYLNKDSNALHKMSNSLDDLAQFRGELFELFLQRYDSEKKAQKKVQQLLFKRNGERKGIFDLLGIWSETTKQARIFRQYCDLIVLSDGILLGNHWREKL